MPAEYAKRIESLLCSPIRKTDVHGLIEILEGEIRGDAVARFFIVEVNELEALEVVEDLQPKDAPQAQAAAAVV